MILQYRSRCCVSAGQFATANLHDTENRGGATMKRVITILYKAAFWMLALAAWAGSNTAGLAQAATQPAPGLPVPSIAPSIPALADPAGIRAALAAKGILLGLNYIGDVFGNVSGGIRRGAVYEGRLELVADADLEKLAGWQGSAFHFNAYQIHGTGLSRYYVGNLMPTSNIEALAATRLYEAWFEQKLLDGKLAVRVGQLGADTEFLASSNAGLFLNGTFGWPQITTSDLPSGGAAYPLATPGLRVKYAATEQWTIMAGVFNGDPAGRGILDPQKRNRHGLDFCLQDPPFLIGEAQYGYNQGKDAAGLAGTVKIGAWQHFGRFDDQRFGTDGLSLANPLSNAIARRKRGDSGIYGLIDQQIYRLPGDDATKGIGVFARVSASPQDRNLVDLYVDGGVTFSGLFASRPDDAFGASFAYTRISDRAASLDKDSIAFGATARPVRDYEGLIEVTYQAQILPGWTAQPNFQYIFHPGGHVPNPGIAGGATPIRDAAVFGLRTSIKY